MHKRAQKKQKSIFLFLSIFLTITFFVTQAFSHNAGFEEKVWSLQNAVTVDGNVGANEWSDASTIIISGLTDTANSDAQQDDLYIKLKHDGTDLFLYAEKENGGGNGSKFMVYFDVNHDGTLDAGDLAFQVDFSTGTQTFYQGDGAGAWTTYTPATPWTYGRQNNSGIIEMGISLSDIGLNATGDIAGFGLLWCDKTASAETIGWPDFMEGNPGGTFTCPDLTTLDPPSQTPTEWGNITRTTEEYTGISDPPVDWSTLDGEIRDYTYRGGGITDWETSKDPSNGGSAVQPDNIDIASDTLNSSPGDATSVQLSFYDGGTTGTAACDADRLDDTVMFRTWVDGDPSFKTGYASRNWNFLLDVDGDGYKEFWIDLAGWYSQNGADVIYVYYDDSDSNDIDSSVEPVYTLHADSVDGDGDVTTWNGSGISFASYRAVDAGRTGEGTNVYDYEINVQIPVKYLDEADNGLQDCSISSATPMSLFYSTSTSNTDPLQKDWMGDFCGLADSWTPDQPLCFGDAITLDPRGTGGDFTLTPLAYDETVGPGTVLNFAHQVENLISNTSQDVYFLVNTTGTDCGTPLLYEDTNGNGIRDTGENTLISTDGTSATTIQKGSNNLPLNFVVEITASSGADCTVDVYVSDTADSDADGDFSDEGGNVKQAADHYDVLNSESNVKINELMYDPATGDEWLEITNTSQYYEMDVAGWTISDGDGNTYTIPAGLAPMPPSGECSEDEARIIIVFGSPGTTDTDWTGDCLVRLYTGTTGWFENDADDVSLCADTSCSSFSIIDYVAYGADAGEGDDFARVAGIWDEGMYAEDVDTGHSLSRMRDGYLRDGYDTNQYTDWYDAYAPSPGEENTPSIVINEVEINDDTLGTTSSVDWAELYVIEDGVAGANGLDIKDMVLTADVTGASGSALADTSVTVSSGDYLSIHWTTGTDETDNECIDLTDSNTDCSDGIDLYVDSAEIPSSTNEELVLMTDLTGNGGIYLDAVTWGTGNTGTLTGNTLNDVSVPMWDGTTTVDTSGFGGTTIGRDSVSTDSNSASDWDGTGGVNAIGETPNLRNVGVLINEIMIDPITGNQWVELYSPNTVDFSATNYSLERSDGTTFTISSGTIDSTNPYLKVDLGATDFLGSSSESLGLYDTSSNIVDYVAYGSEPDTTTAGSPGNDAVTAGQWTTDDFLPIGSLSEGETIGRDRNETDTNTSLDWDTHGGVDSIEPTPSAQNLGGSLVINEVMYDPSTGYEWVELYNPTGSSISIDGYVIADAEENNYTIPADLEEIPAGEYLVIILDDGGSSGSDDYSWNDGDPAYLHADFVSGGSDSDSLGTTDVMSVYQSCTWATDCDDTTILDFVAWGGAPDTTTATKPGKHALDKGIWDSGDYFDTTDVSTGESIGRDKNSSDIDQPSDWSDHGGADAIGTTQGEQNIGSVIINEVSFKTTSEGGDWIEIYNPTDNALDLDTFSICIGDTECYNFPDLERIPSGEYLIIHTGSSPSGSNDTAWSDGDEAVVYLGVNDTTALDDSCDLVGVYNNQTTRDATTLVDFVSYGCEPDTSAANDYPGYHAVQSGLWPDGSPVPYVDVSAVATDESIGRDKSSTDTNATGDWSGTGGADAGDSTYAAQNYTTVLQPSGTNGPTYIILDSFRVFEANGKVVVEWITDSEIGVAGYHLYRKDGTTGRFFQINDSMLPAVMSSPQGGGIYRFGDDSAEPGKDYMYKLIEVRVDGVEKPHGPFTVFVKPDGGSVGEFANNYAADPKPVSEKQKTRIEKRLKEKIKIKSKKKKIKGTVIKIGIRERGLYFIPAEKIAEIMMVKTKKASQWIKQGKLKLTNFNEPVAWLPADDLSGMYFYGEKINSIFTDENIYRLTPDKGQIMETVESPNIRETAGTETFMAETFTEVNRYPVSHPSFTPETDIWFWDFFIAGYPNYNRRSFSIRTDHVDTMGGKATLYVSVFGATNKVTGPDHRAVAYINGTSIGEVQWDGNQIENKYFIFDSYLLNDGVNTVEIEAIRRNDGSASVFYIDSLSLYYPRFYQAVDNRLFFHGDDNPVVTVSGFSGSRIMVMDVTNPFAPARINAKVFKHGSGFGITIEPADSDNLYLAVDPDTVTSPDNIIADQPSDLRSVNNSADYIIIVPPGWEQTAQPLAQYREREGLLTMIVDLENIMDEFNYGIYSPYAIRDFLKHAFSTWGGAPKFVVLAGRGTCDYRDFKGFGENLIPPVMGETPYGLVPADNIYADVSGNDGIPEIAVGRLPVMSTDELSAVIEKLTNHESIRGTGWSNLLLMLADNGDDAGDFPADSDALIATFPETFNTQRIYLSEMTRNDARRLFFDAMTAGAGFVNYIGHGGIRSLAREKLLTYEDVSLMKNFELLPLMTFMTCSSGRFDVPGFPSLAESLLLFPEGGASAVWTSSGLSWNDLSQILVNLFYINALSGEKERIGEAVLQALRDYGLNGYNPFMINNYNLFGDPATRFKHPNE